MCVCDRSVPANACSNQSLYCYISAVPMNSGSYSTQPGATESSLDMRISSSQPQSLGGFLETMTVHPGSTCNSVVATGQQTTTFIPRLDISSDTGGLTVQRRIRLSMNPTIHQATSYQGLMVHDNLLQVQCPTPHSWTAQTAQYQTSVPAQQLHCTEVGQSQAVYSPDIVSVERAQPAAHSQHALKWLQADDMLQLQQAQLTAQWRTSYSPSTPTEAVLHANVLQHSPPVLQLQLLQPGAQLQQQQLLQLQLQELGQSCQHSPSTAAIATCTASSAASIIGGDAGSRVGAVVPVRHAVIRDLSYAQQWRQQHNHLVVSTLDPMLGPVAQHQDNRGGQAVSHKVSTVSGAQQATSQVWDVSRMESASQQQQASHADPSAGPIVTKLPVITHAGSQRNQVEIAGAVHGTAPGGFRQQQAQRTTGLSHRQRYRRKQWELQRATEQQRMQAPQQQQQQQDMRQGGSKQVQELHASRPLQGLSSANNSSTPMSEQLTAHSVAADSNTQAGSDALQPNLERITTSGTSKSQAAASTRTATAVGQKQQQVPVAAPAVSRLEADHDLDEWLSKLLDL